MTQPLRLVHASDLHLEMPVHGLPEVPDHLRELLIEAPYHAAEQVFETALAEDADAVLLAGDVLNVDRAGPPAIVLLLDQFRASRIAKFRCIGQAALSTLQIPGREVFPYHRMYMSSPSAVWNRSTSRAAAKPSPAFKARVARRAARSMRVGFTAMSTVCSQSVSRMARTIPLATKAIAFTTWPSAAGTSNKRSTSIRASRTTAGARKAAGPKKLAHTAVRSSPSMKRPAQNEVRRDGYGPVARTNSRHHGLHAPGTTS